MMTKRAWIWIALTAALAACESGDINLSPTNVDNSTNTGGGGGGGTTNPCASYTVGGTTRQGSFDGTNCTYSASFASDTNPITVDLRIPFFSGVHIFQSSLVIGTDVPPNTGPAPASLSGPDLIIEAGNTLAFSDSGDYLLINRGSRILAEGSAAAPITFTGFTDAVTHTAGPLDVQLWGGLVINGLGITNNCTDAQRTANDCHVESEGRPSFYGGNNNADDSGILRYVVIKHSGFEVAPGDELNGITFNAVGSATVVENVEVYSAYDDGFEFFGGAVNVTNFLALYVRDDSIDFSDGYVGTIKNALVIHPPQNGNNCIEGDSIASSRIPAGGAAGNASTAPISMPTIRHLTCMMSNFDAGTHGASRGAIIRFGARAVISDSIFEAGRGSAVNGVAAPTNVCWELDNSATPDTLAAAAAGTTNMSRTVVACQNPVASDAFANGDNQTQWILNAGGAAAYPSNLNNQIVTDPANALTRVLEPDTFYSFDGDGNATNTTISIANATGVLVPIPAPDQYIGAVRASADWTANWTYGIAANNRGIAPWWDLTP